MPRAPGRSPYARGSRLAQSERPPPSPTSMTDQWRETMMTNKNSRLASPILAVGFTVLGLSAALGAPGALARHHAGILQSSFQGLKGDPVTKLRKAHEHRLVKMGTAVAVFAKDLT